MKLIMENWRKFILQEKMTKAMRDRIKQIPAADAEVPASGLNPDKIRTRDVIAKRRSDHSGFQSLPIDHIRLDDVYKRAQNIVLKKAKNPFLKKLDKVAPGWPGLEYKIGQSKASATKAWVPGKIHRAYRGVKKPQKYLLYIHDLPYLRLMVDVSKQIFNIISHDSGEFPSKRKKREYTTRQELKTVTDIVHDFAALIMASTLIHELRHIYDQERYRMRYLEPILNRRPHRGRGKEPIADHGEDPKHPKMDTRGWGRDQYPTLKSQVLEKYARKEEVKFAPIMKQEMEKIIQRIGLFVTGGTPISVSTPEIRGLSERLRNIISNTANWQWDFHMNTSKWFEKVKKRNARDKLTAKLMAKYMPNPKKSDLHHGD